MNNNNKINTHKTACFELFDHTADIGVFAYGSKIEDVFEQAAKSMFSIIFHGDPPGVEPKGEYQIKLKSSDLDQLMVDWLDEILYIYSTEHIVISDYQIDVDPHNLSINANIKGEQLSDDKLLGTCEIKAITYHMLYIKKEDEHWKARVLFDI